MNIRQAITRNITYSKVTVTYKEDIRTHIVYGETSKINELKKWLKANADENDIYLPTFEVETVTEKRAISIEDFIKNSIIIEKDEDNGENKK
jgi:hypothetical protein